jgi:hypothetical protein
MSMLRPTYGVRNRSLIVNDMYSCAALSISARARQTAGYVRGHVPVGGVPMSDLRVGNAERTEVIALLTRALDDGHLTLAEYDGRIATVSAASHVWELATPLNGLPPEFGWLPAAAQPPAAPGRNTANYGRISLILGLVSLPLSVCFVGWVFGILAIVYAGRAGGRGFSAALIGRVLGIVSILLTVAAGAAVFFAMRHNAAP